MRSTLHGKKILLGVSGGIAAYKAPFLVRALTAEGCEVRCVLTLAARQFVTPLALQAVSHQPVGLDLFDPAYEQQIGHIELARWPDAILLAPATAHLIARIAHGLCDDLLTTLICATTAPVLVAPAMNTQMWRNPAVVDNVERLRTRLGHRIIPPDAGELACQEVGDGRLPDPPVLLDALAEALTPAEPLLVGRKVVVTAGPTAEAIDPVRFITNHASGKMGYAIAAAAAAAGARVVLVSGPTRLQTPRGVQRVDVRSARQMRDAVFAHAVDGDDRADAVVKAAAVADYRPAEAADHKLKKAPGPITLHLERTDDILAQLCALPEPRRPFLVGFAAETHNVEELALAKLQRKPVDLLVANLVGGPTSAFGADTSTILFVTPDRRVEPFGPASKSATALEIIRRIARGLT